MPEIPTYNAPSGAIRPSDIATEAYASAGRMAGRLGEERGQLIRQGGQDTDRALAQVGSGLATLGDAVDKHQAQQEIIRGAVGLSSLTDALTKAHNAVLSQADPFDTDVNERFTSEHITPALNDFVQSFHTAGGKAWATAHAADLATNFYRQTAAETANRAGDMAVTGYNTIVNKLTSAVQANPGMIDASLAQIPGTMKALAANAVGLSPDQAGKIETEGTQKAQAAIVKDGLSALIRTDPEGAYGIVSSGKYDQYISGADKNEMIQKITIQARLNQEQQDHNAVTQNRINNENFKATLGQTYSSFIQSNGVLVVPGDLYSRTIPSLSQLPGYAQNPEALKDLDTFAQHVKEQNASGILDTTDQTVQDGFLKRAYDPANPLTAIDVDRAKAHGLLSNGDYARDRQMAEDQDKMTKLDPQTASMVSEGFKALRDTVNPKGGMLGNIGTTGGPMKEAAVMRWAVPAYQGFLRSGMTPAQAMDKVSNDPMVARITSQQPAAADAVPVTTGKHSKPLTGPGGWFQ